MTELVNEQRTGVQVFDSVLLSPFKCLLPGSVTLWRKRKGGRAESQNVHQQRFVVSLVSIADKAALRRPAVDDRDIFHRLRGPPIFVARHSIKSPLPISAAKERIGRVADFTLGW